MWEYDTPALFTIGFLHEYGPSSPGSESRKCGELGADRPDFGGRNTRGEGLAKTEKGVVGVGEGRRRWRLLARVQPRVQADVLARAADGLPRRAIRVVWRRRLRAGAGADGVRRAGLLMLRSRGSTSSAAEGIGVPLFRNHLAFGAEFWVSKCPKQSQAPLRTSKAR